MSKDRPLSNSEIHGVRFREAGKVKLSSGSAAIGETLAGRYTIFIGLRFLTE